MASSLALLCRRGWEPIASVLALIFSRGLVAAAEGALKGVNPEFTRNMSLLDEFKVRFLLRLTTLAILLGAC